MNQRFSVRNDSEGVNDYSFELKIQLESAEKCGNDDDSGWEDEIDLEKEKEAQSKFIMAKLDHKFFFTQSNTDDEIINLDHNIVNESEQSESEEENLCDVNIDVKLKFLKEELENQHNKMKCHIWIHNQNYKVTPIKFKKFIEQNLLTQLGVSKKKTIDVSTAVRWLNIFGYTKQRQKQGVYYDGYEHADAKNRELPLRKKGNGKSIMINKFLTEIDGRLKLKPTDIEQYPTVLAEACEYLEPGKDREGYWIAENVLNQIKTKAILIFEILYPNCIGVFAFDNSSNHAIFAKDALVSKRMNLNSGGLQPKMHDTY
ncbi:uncharacterized protein OCT59_030011 [Rhizophagus irregularis]|uniref:uncharacterized protein n=1 Tax=Rhizophagus irregularis TaxID=588596 RepID=UPI00331C6F90|nr:hypothetical protein OCT59_030011 [Rhizophagus irregularis]